MTYRRGFDAALGADAESEIFVPNNLLVVSGRRCAPASFPSSAS